MARENMELENRVFEELSRTDESCAFLIAGRLYPGAMEDAEDFKSAMGDVSAALGRLSEKGMIEKSSEFAGVEFFRARTSGGQGLQITEPAAKEKKEFKRSADNVERLVLEALKEGAATPAVITAKIFPYSASFRARTSQIFVCLKRLEKKGLVKKENKSYALSGTKDEEAEQKEVEVPEQYSGQEIDIPEAYSSHMEE